MIKLRPSHKKELVRFVLFESEDDTREFINSYSLSEHVECFERDYMIHLSITQDDKLVGFFLLCFEEGTVEFRRVVVAKSARGVGQQAIQEMHSYCANELKARKIWLDVFEHNERGRHIYSKMGYTVVASQEHEGNRLLVMEKHIPH